MDTFVTQASDLESPGRNFAAVTPSDSTDLTYLPRALWVGGSGDLTVVSVAGDTATFSSASGWMPIRPARVLATGTTATTIVAVW